MLENKHSETMRATQYSVVIFASSAIVKIKTLEYTLIPKAIRSAFEKLQVFKNTTA